MSHDESLHPDRKDGSRPEAPPLGPYAWWADEEAERPRVWDVERNRKRLFGFLYGLCGLLVVLDLVVDRHGEHPWEDLPEFYVLYGFVGIVILVFGARVLRRLVMRSEDYYDVR